MDCQDAKKMQKYDKKIVDMIKNNIISLLYKK